MMNVKYLMIALTLALAVSVAGCTVTQATDRSRYGDYLIELENGNIDAGGAREQYDLAAKYFSLGRFGVAMAAVGRAQRGYFEAAGHYDRMARNASSPDQRAYAMALMSYAQSCIYASTSYSEAYAAYARGDRFKGESSLKDAADFIWQANEQQRQAVELQPRAMAFESG